MRAVVVVALLQSSCVAGPPTAGGCVNSDDCDAGEVCLTQECRQVCVADRDCGNDCCGDGVCTAGCSRLTPEVTAVDGLGEVDGSAGHTAHRLTNRIEITGSNFDGASVLLTGPGFDNESLTVCDARSSRLEVELPAGLTAGSYTLSVANQAGVCGVTLPILQGEQGEQGDAGLSATGDLTDVIGGAGIDVGSGSGPAPTVSIDSAGCANGHALLWTGTDWACGGTLEADGVTTTSLQADEVITASLDADVVTTPSLQADVVNTPSVQAGDVDTTSLQADEVTTTDLFAQNLVTGVYDAAGTDWSSGSVLGATADSSGTVAPGCSTPADRGKIKVMSFYFNGSGRDLLCYCKHIAASGGNPMWRCFE